MNHPALPLHPGNLNDSHCDSSITEVGVLVTIPSHGPTPHEGGTCYHWWRAARPTLLLYPPYKREAAYLSDGLSYPCTPAAPRWDCLDGNLNRVTPALP
ncbi:hypothetical protein AVEN_190598-1 [Araneus ventricosus]|uniref:Uncharacterized protein n=1 Tax=Araneus ventricosus TaxID=182803 RepID=A0A4Y2CEK5_ARAVE|nr:hypothetical protein AVEN_190598-1 [Araneus ventricosus]